MKRAWIFIVLATACADPSQPVEPAWGLGAVPTERVAVTWSTPLDGGVVGLFVEHCVWVATVGSIYCIEPTSGVVRWQEPLAGVVAGPVAMRDGAVVATKTGDVIGFGRDGGASWRVHGDLPVTQVVADAHGVVAATSQGDLTAFDFEGNARWEFALDAPPTPMAADAQGVVVGGAHGHVVALDPDGAILWTRALNGPATRAPVLAGNEVVVTSADACDVLNRTTGERVRTLQSVASRGQPVAQPGKVWVPSEALTAFDDDKLVWSRDLSVGWGGIVGSADALIVATEKDVYALDAATGKTRWRQKFDVPIWQAPKVRDGIYVAAGASIVRLGDQPAAKSPE